MEQHVQHAGNRTQHHLTAPAQHDAPLCSRLREELLGLDAVAVVVELQARRRRRVGRRHMAQAVEVAAQRAVGQLLALGVVARDGRLRHMHLLGDAGEDPAVEVRHAEPLGHPWPDDVAPGSEEGQRHDRRGSGTSPVRVSSRREVAAGHRTPSRAGSDLPAPGRAPFHPPRPYHRLQARSSMCGRTSASYFRNMRPADRRATDNGINALRAAARH